MNLKTIFLVLMIGLLTNNAVVGAKVKPLNVGDDVVSMKVKNPQGFREFSINDGYQEKVMRKVVEWINSAKKVEVASNKMNLVKNPISLTLKMRNGDIATIEPVFNCTLQGDSKYCVPTSGEVIISQNKEKILFKAPELQDWLVVGWKYEVEGPRHDVLLEETLYARYYTYLDKAYSDFISCPRIDNIERIEGDTRRHIVYASALNYSGHHNGHFDRIIIKLTDTPEHDVQINKVKIHKSISEKESLKQCR
ncbi:hypothetical protein [Bacillus sp. REN16]|uniref:hypothetical protein n=1 Tax=Bacillus sp. REN16 TaxID=2887296 RepID=UPI001E44594B|nr:hypothetical protein [Bacillus sp. REN16]MCC3356055.1 hypothetical protein [Bacillus sp. REN16]